LLNWTYAPENTSTQLDFMMYYLSVRLGLDLPALEPGLPIEKGYRSMHFSSSTDHIIVVHYEPPGCVRVLDASHPERIPPSLPEAMYAALPLSNLALIQTEQTPKAAFPSHLFDLADDPSWCLYFQEAELAAQRGDWTHVAKIGDDAYVVKDQAYEMTEHFVFIEGYLRAGQNARALEISDTLSELTQGAFDDRICSLWQGVANDLGDEMDQSVDFQEMMRPFCPGD
jgi:hypothetical protein